MKIDKTNMDDLVFNAWVTIDDYPELPDNIMDMPEHNRLLCEQMKRKDPRLCALTNQELVQIINAL